MKIYFLTHQREIERKTNTGSLALKLDNGLVERIIWNRINPNKKLLALFESNNAALLYPHKQSNQSSVNDFENFVIIDSTWQESRKIFNKSEYLKTAPHIKLSHLNPSIFQLRRNQTTGGLCTIECIIELLAKKGEYNYADELRTEFIQFNNQFQNSKIIKKLN